MKVRIDNHGENISYWLWCPGCDEVHRITNQWEFDGNVESPTFSPSILTGYPANPDASEEFKEWRTERRCHSFIKNGVWEFLSDCTHSLANQSTPMVDLPEWLTEEKV